MAQMGAPLPSIEASKQASHLWPTTEVKIASIYRLDLRGQRQDGERKREGLIPSQWAPRK